MSNDASEMVSLIGLGDMGSALATALLSHGVPLTVWNRSPAKAESLVARGATLASTVVEALSTSPVTVVCVSNYAATMEALAGEEVSAAVSGKSLIQLSSMTSAESLALADWATAAGCDYLDGQILSYTDEVLEGRANIVCSGPRELFERHRATLTAAAGNVHHVGERHGAAPTFDKAHLSFALGNYLAFLHGAAMCADSGVDLRAWCDFNLQHLASGQVHQELGILADQVCARSYDGGLDVSIDGWRNAMAKTIQECEALGTDAAHLGPLVTNCERAIEAGFGSREIGLLFEQMRARKA